MSSSADHKANSMRRRGPRRPEPMRVALLGGFGGGNIGNDASLAAGIQMLRQCGHDIVPIAFCPSPRNVEDRFGVTAEPVRVQRPGVRKFGLLLGRLIRGTYRVADVLYALRIMGSIDALIIPGTGIFEDYGSGKPYKWPLTLAAWFCSARIRGTTTALVSVGAGYTEHPVSRFLKLTACRLAHYRSFRDVGSRDAMQSMGLRTTLDPVVPDIVFSLVTENRPASLPMRQVVAVPVMNYLGWRKKIPEIGERLTRTLSDFCTWLIDEGYEVLLISADWHDAPATDRVAQAIRSATATERHDCVRVRNVDTIEQFNALISSVTVVVASRYHAIIGALSCGRPTISLSYASKNDELMNSVGLSNFCQPIEKVDQQLLRRQFRDLVRDWNDHSARIVERVAEFRRQFLTEGERVCSLMKHRG